MEELHLARQQLDEAVGHVAATEFSDSLRMFREVPNIDAVS